MSSDSLSMTFAALADPPRRALLEQLAGGVATVTELAAPFDMSLPAISKHLKVLERAGLIERGRYQQWRPAQLRPDRLREVSDWVEQYRRFWTGSFERLDDYLRGLQQGGQDAEGQHEPWWTSVRGTRRRSGDQRAQDVRRAARAGVRRVHEPGAHRPLVGAGGVPDDDGAHGRAAGWCLTARDARTGWHGLPECRRVPGGRAAGQAFVGTWKP